MGWAHVSVCRVIHSFRQSDVVRVVTARVRTPFFSVSHVGDVCFAGSTARRCCSPTPRLRRANCAGCDLLGRPSHGGYLVNPANVLTSEIPFENLVALFEAAHTGCTSG